MSKETKARASRGRRPWAASSGQFRAPACAIGLLAAIMSAAVLPGCAVAMLGGAARSSGSGGASAPASNASVGGSASSAGQPLSQPAATDSAISAAVRSRLSASSTLRALKIGVDTHDGIVTLRGQVNTLADKSAAQAEARAASGVKGVNNQLTVR